MNKDSNAGTLIVAFGLCFICSVVVSGAATALKERQVFNQKLDIKKNILLAAGLIDKKAKGEEILKVYEKVRVEVVNLDTGEAVTDVNPEEYDASEALSKAEASQAIPAAKDLANIKKRENWSKVYRIVDEQDVTQQVIIPIRGKGLWSTMYGFLAVDPMIESVKGLSFYSHGETPGLGGEIDNPSWKAQFPGKSLFRSDGSPALTVVKGSVNPSDPESKYQVDGLSGATITSVGVANLLQYWLGAEGFGPYFSRIRGTL